MQGEGDALNSFPVLGFDLFHAPTKDAAAIPHLLDIAAGAESLALTGNHQYGDLRGAVCPLHRSEDVIDKSGSREGITHIIPLENQGGYTVVQRQLSICEIGYLRHVLTLG